MSANDADDWIRREIDWLAVPLKENRPILGLCLGAQMLARKLGARVFSHPDRRGEAGYYPIRPLPAADRLCSAQFPRFVYQWHFDGFDLPDGAELLASGGPEFPNQAFRYGRSAIALQFHPEVTYQMMCRWTIHGAERLTRPGARAPHEHLHGWYEHDRDVSAWIDAFLTAWLDRKLFSGAKSDVERTRASCARSPAASRFPGAAAPPLAPASPSAWMAPLEQ